MSELNSHPFDALTPDVLIDAVESQGFLCDGRFLALNSYENRVYQIGIEDKTPMIVKLMKSINIASSLKSRSCLSSVPGLTQRKRALVTMRDSGSRFMSAKGVMRQS